VYSLKIARWEGRYNSPWHNGSRPRTPVTIPKTSAISTRLLGVGHRVVLFDVRSSRKFVGTRWDEMQACCSQQTHSARASNHPTIRGTEHVECYTTNQNVHTLTWRGRIQCLFISYWVVWSTIWSLSHASRSERIPAGLYFSNKVMVCYMQS